jgi:hypothetical protein
MDEIFDKQVVRDRAEQRRRRVEAHNEWLARRHECIA